MRRYFEYLERCEYLPNSTSGHGFTSWLVTSRADLKLALGNLKVVSIIKAAAAAMGHSLLTMIPELIGQPLGLLVRDVNSIARTRDMTEGIYQLPLAMSQEKRNGTRDFLVDTAKKYPLDIRTGCLATRVLFQQGSGDDTMPKAIGVEFLEGSSLYKADPRSGLFAAGTKEVIFSGGASNTPQLLKLSGVGPEEELKRFGIPVVRDLPSVGTNLWDRYEVPIVSKIKKDLRRKQRQPQNVTQGKTQIFANKVRGRS